MKRNTLLFIGFIAFLTIFFHSETSSASEINSSTEVNNVAEQANTSTSINYSFNQVFEKNEYMPQKIWQSRSGYSGYVYLIRYEYTKNDNFLAFYRGTLYKNVAPLKVMEEE